MNTHDKYELPPLPEWVDWPVTVSEMSASEIKEAMQAYARAAIEADRKRRGEPVAWPTHEFAIVVDRMYEGEGPSLAMWNGENYQFSDGDCYDRETDGSLDGYTAEWLTHHQLEQRLLAPQPAEPCVSSVSDKTACGSANGDYDSQPAEPVNKTDWNTVLSSWSDDDFVRVFHERPDLADRLRKMLSEPVKRKHRYAQGTALGEFGIIPMCDQVNDEPVKVVSDDEIMSVVRYSTVGSAAIQDDEWCAFARAILARYGNAAQPIDPANDDPTPEEEEAWQRMERRS